MIDGKNQINLIFDLLIPDKIKDPNEIKNQVVKALKKKINVTIASLRWIRILFPADGHIFYVCPAVVLQAAFRMERCLLYRKKR